MKNEEQQPLITQDALPNESPFDYPETVRPYHERSSVGVDVYVEAIYSEPERELSIEEKQAAYDFSSNLFEGKIEGGACCSARLSLEKIDQIKALTSEQRFFLSYFESEAGKKDLVLMGFDKNSSIEQIKAGLVDIDFMKRTNPETGKRVIPDKTRKEIAYRSRDYYRDGLAKRLTDSAEFDSRYEAEDALIVNYDPNKLIGKIAAIKAYRKFYKQVSRELGSKDPNNVTDLDAAKRVLLEMHQAKVNNMLASLYPHVFSLEKQLELSKPTRDIAAWKSRLEELLPVVHAGFSRERSDQTQSLEDYSLSFGRRLDALKHGVAWSDTGHLTPIQPELVLLAGELADTGQPVPESAPIFRQEVIQKLETTKWEAEQVKIFMQKLLTQWGLLSAHESDWEEVSRREGPAPDDKWQVVITPQKNSMSVDNILKVQFVPEKFSRTLIQTQKAGALFVVPHEATHVLQDEHDEQLAENIPLAKLHGRGTSSLREAGTISQEQRVYTMLGQHRATNTGYLRALQAKLAGGNRLQVARAYYDQIRLRLEPTDENLQRVRETAVDSTARLFANAKFNSQPLVYMEQELIQRALYSNLPEDKAVALMIQCASFSLRDTARLRYFGLIEPPDELRGFPARDAIQLFSEQFLPKVLETSSP